MLHLMLPKFNPCSWKSLGEPKTGCEPVWLLPADSRKHAQRNKDLCPLDINSGNEGRTNEGNTLLYTRCVFTASWKTLFAILRTISNFNLDWEAPTVSPICKIGFAPPHKVLLRFFLRSVSSKTFGPFAKYHFLRKLSISIWQRSDLLRWSSGSKLMFYKVVLIMIFLLLFWWLPPTLLVLISIITCIVCSSPSPS